MAGRKVYHVIAALDGGWAVVKSGAERASKRFASQADAVQWGRQVSRNQGIDLYIHRNDGTVERKDSFGDDSHPPRG
jgi:uncharacterized protein DUF2188